METWVWIVIVAAIVVVLLALAALWATGARRRRHLQERFGPEYDRAVSDTGRRDAERRLSSVEAEHDEAEIRSLSAAARARYMEDWRNVETRFVSDPEDAARAADRVVLRALEERGYPVGSNPGDRAAHLAVDHPDVVERYRHGRAMLEDDTDGSGSTENLRKAMLDFRTVFEEVVERERSVA